MSRATFCLPFDPRLPTWPGEAGRDQIVSASRIGLVPIEGVPTNVVLIEALEDVMADLKARSGWLFVEDIDGPQGGE